MQMGWWRQGFRFDKTIEDIHFDIDVKRCKNTNIVDWLIGWLVKWLSGCKYGFIPYFWNNWTFHVLTIVKFWNYDYNLPNQPVNYSTRSENKISELVISMCYNEPKSLFWLFTNPSIWGGRQIWKSYWQTTMGLMPRACTLWKAAFRMPLRSPLWHPPNPSPELAIKWPRDHPSG